MSFLFAQQNHIQKIIIRIGNGRRVIKNGEQKTIPLPMLIQQHYEIIIFDVFGFPAHNVILNIFWLKTHNPIIDWKNKIFTFQRVRNVTNTVTVRTQLS